MGFLEMLVTTALCRKYLQPLLVHVAGTLEWPPYSSSPSWTVHRAPILGVRIWQANRASTDYDKFFEKPVITIGVFFMVVSIPGLIGACCRVSLLLWVYLLAMFFPILLLFWFIVFAFVVTKKGVGSAISNCRHKEYYPGDYSNWL